jgi:hypothetical protein
MSTSFTEHCPLVMMVGACVTGLFVTVFLPVAGFPPAIRTLENKSVRLSIRPSVHWCVVSPPPPTLGEDEEAEHHDGSREPHPPGLAESECTESDGNN